jgi:hypothetical protein
LAFREERGQGSALDQLHREKRPPVGQRAHLVYWNNSWVLELATELRLLDEPADHAFIITVPFQQGLECQVA